MSRRIQGKASFAELQDFHGRKQVYFHRDELSPGENKELYNEVYKKLLDIGDIIGLEGELFKTQVGEKTLMVKNLKLLSKSLRPLPIPKTDSEGNIYDHFNDHELRYRQRYLDLILNPTPENLYEDGMISDADGDLKYEQLMKQWRLLEKEIEREVTEEEIWEQLAFTDLYIDDNDLDAIVRFDLRKNKWLTRKDY